MTYFWWRRNNTMKKIMHESSEEHTCIEVKNIVVRDNDCNIAIGRMAI
jgi:hypothetical protein